MKHNILDLALIVSLMIGCTLIIAPMFLIAFGLFNPVQAAMLLFAGIVFSITIAGAMALFDRI